MSVSPLLIALLGAAGILTAGICLVLGALCRRHYGTRSCHQRANNTTKHVPMEAVIAAEDLIIDGSVTGVRSPATPDTLFTETIRNGAPVEDCDPDIIRNQYERRSGLGFTKVYQVPGSREDEDVDEEADEYDIKRAAKESQVPNQIVYRSLQRSAMRPIPAPAPVIPGTQTLTQQHKYRGPEVVTTSNRIQESCI